jgi:ribosomal-protein-alanine N-acetyltransferase
MTILTTDRLILEPYDDQHLDGLSAMSADPEVMRHLPGTETREQTKMGIERVKARWREWGHSWWAFRERASQEIIGAGCIQYLNGDPTQMLEIGWRLRQASWRQGFASEAARAMAAFAFDRLNGPILASIALPANIASQRVMERLGMTRQPGLARYYGVDLVLYLITQEEWRSGAGAGADSR